MTDIITTILRQNLNKNNNNNNYPQDAGSLCGEFYITCFLFMLKDRAGITDVPNYGIIYLKIGYKVK